MSFGVYVHYPYCIHHCPYCDFNVAVVKSPPHERYLRAVIHELELRMAEIGPRPAAVSVYFGGGTPGIWPAENIASVIEFVDESIGMASNAEVTVECNPEATDGPFFESLLVAGVTRLSIGAQSFDDEILGFLGRNHRAADIERAVGEARAAGFKSISIDLIHGSQAQRTEDALNDVDRAAGLGVDHISTYQLTIENQTPFGARHRRGDTLLGNEDRLIEMFESLRTRLRSFGFEPYEISSAARPGHESRHNTLYWSGGEFLGVGAGAHGRFFSGPVVARYSNERSHLRYMQSLEAHALPEAERVRMDSMEWLEEKLITGLRLERGLLVDEILERRFGAQARRLVDRGLMSISGGRWAASDRGRLLLDTVIVELLS